MKKFKIWVDENLSKKLLLSLTMFFESTHVASCGLEQTDDTLIWNFAKREGYAILTRDIDFYSLSALLGCPPKIIHLVTPANGESTNYYREKLVSYIPVITDFLNSKHLCYLKIE